MIKKIRKEQLSREIKLHNFRSPERCVFFEVNKIPEYVKSLADFIDGYKRKNPLDKGIITLETIEENKIFMILYNENETSETEVIKFANSLGL